MCCYVPLDVSRNLRNGNLAQSEVKSEFFGILTQVGWLCLTSNRQRGNLETPSPFNVPCEGREGGFYTVTTGNRTPGHCVAVHYTTAAPHQLLGPTFLNLCQ